MEPNDWIQCGILFIGVLALILYVVEYTTTRRKSALDDVLKNLAQAFAAKEPTCPSYKNQNIKYPGTLVSLRKPNSDID